MSIHSLATLASQLEEYTDELECHELYQDEYTTHDKAEDENDFGYICRYHEQYLDEVIQTLALVASWPKEQCNVEL
jgi:hypothetical protein